MSKIKYKIDIERLRNLDISIIKHFRQCAEDHLKYYHKTMSAFSNPEARVKCRDTMYHEEILPITNQIIKEYNERHG